MTSQKRATLERQQADWAYSIKRTEQALDDAYRANSVDLVEPLTRQLQAARWQHSEATDALMALDGLQWNAGLHRWVTI